MISKFEKISIILPIYNSEKTIHKTLDNLLHQTYKNLEILAIDDGSKDLSYKILTDYSKKDKRVKCFTQKNLGVSRTRNLGIKKATGEYILFIDGDDYLSDDCIEELYKKLSEESIVRANVISIEYDAKPISKKSKQNLILSKNTFLEQLVKGQQQGFIVGILFPTRIIKKISFREDIAFMEDMVFLSDFIQQSKVKKIIITNLAHYYYIQNPQSATNNPTKIIKNCIDINTVIDTLFIANSTISNNIKSIQDNRKARLLENQFSKINNKKIFQKIKADKSIKEILISLIESPKTKMCWKIYLIFFLHTNYFFYKIFLFLRFNLKKLKSKK